VRRNPLAKHRSGVEDTDQQREAFEKSEAEVQELNRVAWLC
jgi:hypothetical protein